MTPSTPVTHTIAINRAVTLLRSVGAKFAIVTKDGEKLGELEVASSKQFTKKFNWAEKLDYITTLKSMTPGDVHVFRAETKEEVESLQSAVSSTCTKLWGKGNAISHRSDNAVEVLRVN